QHRQRLPPGHCPQGTASQERTAERRPADGGAQPRREARLSHQLALRELGRAVLPRRDQKLGDLDSCQARGWPEPGRRLLLDIRAAHSSGSSPGRRRLIRLLLLLVNTACWLWAALVLPVAYHGINPGLCW